MRPLTHKLLRDVRRHRAQFAAVVVTVFLGVTIFAASYDSFRNLQASYGETFVEFDFANLTVAGGDVSTLAAEAAAQPRVAAVHTRTVADVPLLVDDHKLLGRIVGLPADGQPAVNRVKVLRGGYLDPAVGNGVLVEEHMADHFDLRPGDALAILAPEGWRDLSVVGVVSSPEYIWPARDRQEILTTPDNFGVVFGGEALALAATGYPGPNEAVLFYEGGAEDEALTAELSARAAELGAINVYTRAEQPSNAALSEDLQGFEEISVFFPLLFLAAAAMAAYVMISRLVHAQRPQIGVLLANGYTHRQVLRHYLGYGLYPSLAGAVPGVVAGVLLARVITRYYTDMLSVPVTLIRFYPVTLVAGLVIGLLTALAAAGAPALVASRVAPAEAMRGAVLPGRGRPSIPERLLPPLRRLPIRWRMALRGIERSPRRTAYTVLGVVLSLTLILVSWGMIDTTTRLLHLQYREIELQDATVYFAGPVGAGDVESLRAVPGVEAVEPVLHLPVAIAADEGRYETVLVALEADTELHRFRAVGGTWVPLPEEGVLVGKALAAVLDVEPGDEVSLMIGEDGLRVTDRIAGFLDEPLGTIAYASRAHAERIAGMALPASSALIRYEEGADPAVVRAALVELPQVAAFEDAKALFALIQDYMVLFYGFVGVMLAFGAAMAFALIFNSMSVNIAERSREVATLLAVGTDRRTVSRLITTENLLVALGGIGPGLVIGYYTSKAAMASFESDLFSFDLYVRPTTFLWAALAILGVALLSQWPGLRSVARLHIPQIIKERST